MTNSSYILINNKMQMTRNRSINKSATRITKDNRVEDLAQ